MRTTALPSPKQRLGIALSELKAIGHEVPHCPETYCLRWHVEFAAGFARVALQAAEGHQVETPEQTAAACLQGKRLNDWAARKAAETSQLDQI